MMPSSAGLLLNSLPAIYHASEELGTLLSVFEAVLFGTGGEGQSPIQRRQSIHEVLPLANSIAITATLFDAHETPKEFVPWLAQWVALTHLSGLTEKQQRDLLAEIVPLYAQRGTKRYLARLLEFFKPANATVGIDDQEWPGFVVGIAKLGIDSWLERDRPFWFKVEIRMPLPENGLEAWRELRTEWETRLRRVIDLAKPAHTLYELDWQFEDTKD
jgi:phage tail-like protein